MTAGPLIEIEGLRVVLDGDLTGARDVPRGAVVHLVGDPRER
jgi:hypothetical protein